MPPPVKSQPIVHGTTWTENWASISPDYWSAHSIWDPLPADPSVNIATLADDGVMGSRFLRLGGTEVVGGAAGWASVFSKTYWDADQSFAWQGRIRITNRIAPPDNSSMALFVIYNGEWSYAGIWAQAISSTQYEIGLYGTSRISPITVNVGQTVDVEYERNPATRTHRVRWNVAGGGWTAWTSRVSPEPSVLTQDFGDPNLRDPGCFYVVAGPYWYLDVGRIVAIGKPLTGFTDDVGLGGAYWDVSGCAVMMGSEMGASEDPERIPPLYLDPTKSGIPGGLAGRDAASHPTSFLQTIILNDTTVPERAWGATANGTWTAQSPLYVPGGGSSLTRIRLRAVGLDADGDVLVRFYDSTGTLVPDANIPGNSTGILLASDSAVYDGVATMALKIVTVTGWGDAPLYAEASGKSYARGSDGPAYWGQPRLAAMVLEWSVASVPGGLPSDDAPRGGAVEWTVDASTTGSYRLPIELRSMPGAKIRILVNGVQQGDLVTIPSQEEERDPMPASTLGNAGSAGIPISVSCSSSVWTRLDATPLANRNRVLVTNPDAANRLGILFTSSDTVPAAGTAPSCVLGPEYDTLWSPDNAVTEAIRVWGKGIGGTIAATVQQFGT